MVVDAGLGVTLLPEMSVAAGILDGSAVQARAVEGVETKDLKSLVDDGKKQIGSGVVAIVGVTEDGKEIGRAHV